MLTVKDKLSDDLQIYLITEKRNLLNLHILKFNPSILGKILGLFIELLFIPAEKECPEQNKTDCAAVVNADCVVLNDEAVCVCLKGYENVSGSCTGIHAWFNTTAIIQ